MTTQLTTDYKYNFTKAENELFSWTSSEHDFLTYKPTGKQIYQMEWYAWKNSTPVTDQTIKNAVSEFWAALRELQDAEEKAKQDAQNNLQPEKHGSGWCTKCQSYCYGDCDAS
jgi:hypothetical protein